VSTPSFPAPPSLAARTKLILRGRLVVPGIAEGEALVSPEPISGWGGIDPAKGTIIERRHALYGACFRGKILVFPSAKGSSGWAGFFQATRLQGTAPLGLVIARISAKSALGVARIRAIAELIAKELAYAEKLSAVAFGPLTK